MAGVTLQNVTKHYGTSAVVNDVSLQIAPGEFAVFLGPSGCGKTTTLRMIAGFVAPTSGSIRLGARDVTAAPPHRRNTGLVFQNYALFPHMTVAANVAFGLEMRNCPKPEIVERVKAALLRVRLEAFAERMPRQLSGGQQQRVALARALVIEPDVLLLDEPLSNLDTKLRSEMRDEIRALQQSLKLTTILVTHDQEEALAVGDRLVVMNQGRIEQIGTPANIFEMPRSRFVADFTGVANLLAGRGASGGRFVLAGGETVRQADAVAGTEAVLALRPERAELLAAASGRHANELPARVVTATYLGTVSDYRVELASGTRLACRQTNEPGGGAARFAPGEAVWIGWSETAARLVAPE